jgi:hypothetical protein
MARFRCSQCGRAAPADPDELRTWRHGDLAVAGEPDEATVAMLLCPECVEDDLSGEYEAGEPG